MIMQLRDSAQGGWKGIPIDVAVPLDMGLSTGPGTAEIQAMQRAMLRLFEHWGVTDAEGAVLLGDVSLRTLQRWKAGQYGRAGVDIVARMSNLLGIHKALRLLFADAGRGYRWVRAANADFGGRSALDVMLGGQITDLMRVRRYLDAQRGQW
jgi:Protein of unknown function (DUF2384)